MIVPAEMSPALSRPDERGEHPATALSLRRLKKAFGALTVVDAVDLEVPRGSLVSLLGPSGCGKTTTLRMVAGLETVTAGTIELEGRRLNNVPIEDRNIGMVFQNYALFPHMTVADNLAFGLRFRPPLNRDRDQLVQRALELVHLPGLAGRYPTQLSGGQQQRVALARALIIQPSMLLLDEPLSALDANLRDELRIEIRRIQQQTTTTALFVTHDQTEALSMSDYVVIMRQGRIVQQGTPLDVYERPRTRFVADFLGAANLLEGRVVSKDQQVAEVRLDTGHIVRANSRGRMPGERVLMAVRPERVQVLDVDAIGVPAIVETVDYLGNRVALVLRAGTITLRASLPAGSTVPALGSGVKLSLDPVSGVVLDED